MSTEEIRERLDVPATDRRFLRHAEATSAIRAVLDLKPPEQDDEVTAEDCEMLTGAWYTCYRAVVEAIAKGLGVEPE